MSEKDFLPLSPREIRSRGWDFYDFLLVTGDAYVDHPSFGHALIGRHLESLGYRVALLAQPDWHGPGDFLAYGRPRLAVLVSAGNLDSMLNRYTAAKKRRSRDAYSPGGRGDLRPDRATFAYCQRARQAWPDVPLVIGGIEASLRRFAHYDYWSDSVRRSILVDSGADLLVYGMGELAMGEIARLLAMGVPVDAVADVDGTCRLVSSTDGLWDYVESPSFEAVSESREAFAEAFRIQYEQQDPLRGKTVVQRHGARWLVQHRPARPLTTAELDALYELPYVGTWHPRYDEAGGVPAIEEVRFSLVTHRGCYGGCAFCALTSHQGRIIQSRSEASLLEEARRMTKRPDFKGYIHDVGGPTANFFAPACSGQAERGACKGKDCIGWKACNRLVVDHGPFLALLRRLRELPRVKKVFVRSGIRFDYLMADDDGTFLEELCRHHISGQLKVAPEHVSPRVLKTMNKPPRAVFDAFRRAYGAVNEALGKKQYLVPYFLSSHPGSTLEDAVELAEYLRDIDFTPEQVQDFIPTPGSLATAMYYSGLDPMTMRAVHVPRDSREKALQRALLQYRNPKNYDLVREALERTGRKDLIGFGPLCLIRPRPGEVLAGAERGGRRKRRPSSSRGAGPGRKR